MKRFYKSVTVEKAGEGFAIQLDGRAVKTPAKQQLHAPTRALATHMAQEWEQQADEIIPASMPLTSLAYTALDHIAGNRDSVIDQIAGYGDTDLLCYFAGDDEELCGKQKDLWHPLLRWAESRLDLPLQTTDNLMPVQQAPHIRDTLRKRLSGETDWRLAPLSVTTALSGSVVLALALLERELDAAQVFEASVIDELHQAERWGADEEATERREHIREELDQAERFLRFLQDDA
ncbi:MAG: ATP12 family protein [Pseudomonadota bacterium]